MGFALIGKGMDVDSGQHAPGFAKAVGEMRIEGTDLGVAGWARLRAIEATASRVDSEERTRAVDSARDALRQLREAGIKTCVLIRWPADWRKVYLPADLKAAFENGRRLGATYGDLVDAWEIDNEPDLGFVPESAERYAAFLKASYLGLQEGYRMRVRGYLSGDIEPSNRQPSSNNSSAPLVLMGALGLPPGPWLERFAANGGFSYTDGFNYHYYGYAEDFSAVYGQFEAALKQLLDKGYSLTGTGPDNLHPVTNNLRTKKSLSIFVTEIGYGMLGKNDRNTKEGRLRQWRWFKSVGEQANALRIEAPMAFYLPPYLEYETSEYGLTVPPGGTVRLSDESNRLLENSARPGWVAGGIHYSASDFGTGPITNSGHPITGGDAASWMERIGTKIAGNEVTPALAQWMALRSAARLSDGSASLSGEGASNSQPSSNNTHASRSWAVSVPAPSPIVIDFLNGEGLSFVKRYNGSFVTGLGPVTRKPETGNLKPEGQPTKPITPNPQPITPSRSEEFMLHVRTQNGNLFEVYPTRQATGEWQHYMEPRDNFTMSFYGRAELPWRFSENKPASLVVVMYPKSLPATFEFRRAQLIRLGARSGNQANRYGRGKVVLYNFSDREVSGSLHLPHGVGAVVPDAQTSETGALGATRPTITLAPGERREIEVQVAVLGEAYRRFDAPITFVPDDAKIPAAKFVTSFIPDIGGMKATVAARLLPGKLSVSAEATGDREDDWGANFRFVKDRVRATEEAPMKIAVEGKGLVAFAQDGASVESFPDGFAITVTGAPAGKAQRVEVEIPWPDGLGFGDGEFLSMEYRLR